MSLMPGSFSGLQEWDNVASVRTSKDSYDFSQSTIHGHKLRWHLDSYAGILKHPLLSNLDSSQVKKVVGIQLLEFVLKTVRFELDFVNRAANILGSNLDTFKFSDQFRLDALKIYTDEGYHAYFSQKVALQIRNYYSIEDDLSPFINPFLTNVKSLISSGAALENTLSLFALVIVSENNIVSSMSDHMKGVVYEPIRQMLKNHMQDEATMLDIFLNFSLCFGHN